MKKTGDAAKGSLKRDRKLQPNTWHDNELLGQRGKHAGSRDTLLLCWEAYPGATNRPAGTEGAQRMLPIWPSPIIHRGCDHSDCTFGWSSGSRVPLRSGVPLFYFSCSAEAKWHGLAKFSRLGRGHSSSCEAKGQAGNESNSGLPRRRLRCIAGAGRGAWDDDT